MEKPKAATCAHCHERLAHKHGKQAAICGNELCNPRGGMIRDPRRCPYCGSGVLEGNYQSWGVTSLTCRECGEEFAGPVVAEPQLPPQGFAFLSIGAS